MSGRKKEVGFSILISNVLTARLDADLFFFVVIGPCLLNCLGRLSPCRPSAFTSVGLHMLVIRPTISFVIARRVPVQKRFTRSEKWKDEESSGALKVPRVCNRQIS